MNSTPKQQDGDGNVAANGSLSPLEQTVMGVAPPPSSTIVAAPTIALSPAAAASAPHADAVHLPPSRETPAGSDAPIGTTLRIEPSAPAAIEPEPASAREPPRAEPEQSQREQTVLAADYLREARAAALDQVAQRAPTPDAAALASSERAPHVEAASTLADAVALSGDTHRSVAPAFEPGPESTRSRSASVGSPVARGFEPVPVVRAPLAESLSSALGPLAELGGTRNLLPPASRPRPPPPPEREGGGRWLLLAAVALTTVGIVSVGGRLWHRYRVHASPARIASVEASAPAPAAASGADPRSASHALLANRPAPEPGDERVRVISATLGAAPSGEPGVATPESQLAATAGRHVLSGNYAEALPLYRQLERGWPENTSYATMARLLEKKVGSRNDTRTITPASATP